MRRLVTAIALLLPAAAGAQHSCGFDNPNGVLVDFGTYVALQGDDDATGTIDFTCVPDLLLGPAVAYTISISAGTGSAGSFSPRRLRFGGFGLDYNLYTDPARTTVWGDGTAGTATVGGLCAGSCSALVYGRIFGGQSGAAGPYSDEVVVTIDF